MNSYTCIDWLHCIPNPHDGPGPTQCLNFFLLNRHHAHSSISDNTSTTDNLTGSDRTPDHKIPNQPSRPKLRDEPTDFKVQSEDHPASFSPRRSEGPRALYESRAGRELQRAPARSQRDKGRRTACRGVQWESRAPPPLRSSFRLRYTPPAPNTWLFDLAGGHRQEKNGRPP